jgi:general secretion pathway protein E
MFKFGSKAKDKGLTKGDQPTIANFIPLNLAGNTLIETDTDDSTKASASKTTTALHLAAQKVVVPSNSDSATRFSKDLIDSQDDLARIAFERCLNKEFNLAEHLSLQSAVLEIDPKNKICGFLLSQSAGQPLIEALVAQISQRGWRLPDDGPQCWRTTSSNLLMSVVRGHIDSKQLNVIRQAARNPMLGSLWEAFRDIVWWAYQNKANDIDFILDTRHAPGQAQLSQVAFKINGVYTKPERWQIPTETLIQMLGAAWQRSAGGHSSQFQSNEFQQAALKIDGLPGGVRLNLRWSGLPTTNGTTVTMRLQRLGESLPIKSLEEAGYLPWHMSELLRALRAKGGLMTFAGTVGSGKTISLALLMDLLPPEVKIISMEDPVEVEMPNVHQTSIARDLAGGKESNAMKAGVSAALRSAFDHMIWGEVRDKETGLVVRAVLDSGHSVYTTTHAANCLMVVDKYMSPIVDIPKDVLGTPGNIKLNVYQALIPTLCDCALDNEAFESTLGQKELEAHKAYLSQFNALFKPNSQGRYLRWLNPKGCSQCRNDDLPQLRGLKGRTVVAEMLSPDEHMCELILRGDKVAMHRYWRSLSDGDIESGNLAGKTALECAVHKALTLQNIDLRTIERHFESFVSLGIKKISNAHIAAALDGVAKGVTHSSIQSPVVSASPLAIFPKGSAKRAIPPLNLAPGGAGSSKGTATTKPIPS